MKRDKYTIRWTKFLTLLSVAVFLLVAYPHAVYAQNFTPTQVGSNTDALGVGGIGASTGLVDADPRIIAAKIINIALGLLGVIVVGLMIYAGYLWMTAGGDEEKVATAKKILRNAVIGLAIILSSVAITQFIISKLTDAILGAAQKKGGGGGCVGEQCLMPEFSVFYATTTPQSPPPLPIKNVVVSIDFFNGLGAPAVVVQTTISADAGKTILDNAITIVKHGTIDAKGVVIPLPAGVSAEPYKGELKFVDQNTVEFHPIGSCADAENPANSSANTDCFEKNTVYQVTLKNTIASQSGKTLDCNSVHPCVSQFITGEKYDAEPPKIFLVQPGNNALIGNGIATLVSAEMSDDAGIKKVSFYENETNNIVDKILNPFIVSGLVSDQTWKPKLKDPNKAEVAQLTAKAYDIDNHQTLSEPQTVKILPAWCFNNTLDEDKGEEKANIVIGAPDCGVKSECGACQGGGCDTDLDCAAGICIPQPGVKVTLIDKNTKYKAEGVGLPNPEKIIPYYEWYIDGEPLTVAYLPFDKTSDTSKFTSNLSVPLDALNIGQVSHATVAGPKWSATGGVIGSAYQFNNSGDYIETQVLPWKGNQLSVQWWMKRANPVTPKLFVIAQIKDSFSIQTTGQGTVSVSASASGAPNASIQEQGSWPLPPPDGKWHQVTVVFDGSSILYYVDGAQDAASIKFEHIVNATGNPFVIGYKGNKGTIAFDGWIDEARMFTRILNTQQLKADFKSVTELNLPADTLDVNIAEAKAIVTADAWQLSKATYEITNTKAPYREKKGICVNVPKITNVIQKSGAVDNYVTVIGQSFGAYKPGVSSVWFSKVQSPQAAKTDQWVSADLCSVKAWHDNYVVVKAPPGAVTGPIKIEGQSSTLAGFDGLVFRDTTADVFGPMFDSAEVFKITNEKLPGLCTVDPEKAIVGDVLKLTGTQLGGGVGVGDAILLGAENEPLNEFKEWSNFLISNIKIPVNVVSGLTSIKAQVNGKKSNALPFGILSSAEDINPHIFSIDPAYGPVGTYVTIIGKNFGSGGVVTFTQGGQGGDSFVADLPPVYCGDTWAQNQIVVKVPQKIQNKGDFTISVTVKKGTEDAVSNKKIFTVNADSLKPGLCKLEPDNGPLFSAQFGGIAFKGEGFGDAPGSVTFNKAAQVGDGKFFSWSDTLVDAHKFSEITLAAQAQFKTGPVYASNAEKLASNALQFKIQNCKEELQKGKELATVCGEGASCCANGVCAQKGSCPEDKKPGASVYMWSFTTGKLPVVPKVIEQCGKFCAVSGKPCKTTEAEDAVKAKNECDKNITGDVCALVTPSPSPSVIWDGSSEICVNASVKIRFDTIVDIDAQKAPASVLLYDCQDEKKCVLENEKQIVAISYLFGVWSAANKTGTTITLNPVSDLQPAARYGVIVTTQVKSKAGVLSEAMPENAACPAIAAGVTVNGAKNLKPAYCTTFATRATKDYCELGAVAVDPLVYITSEFNKTTADFYSVIPIAKGNLCVALNGDDYNWAWSPTNNPGKEFQKTSEYADISNKIQNIGGKELVKPNQDLTTKNKETVLGKPEQIIATWIDKALNPLGSIKGIAQLIVKLPNPKVTAFWPNCTTACVNAEVGAQFNTALDAASVNKNTVILYKCEQFDVVCKKYSQLSADLYDVKLNSADIDLENQSRKIIITHSSAFAQNTYYKAVLKAGDSGVKSKWNIEMDKGALNNGCAADGTACALFAWVFRTKDSGALCAVDKVNVSPSQAVVSVVGAKAAYGASAIGSPDACNPNGQILDTSGDGYLWNFAPLEKPVPNPFDSNTDRAVVWMSNFASGEQQFSWCTESCVLAGSANAPKAGVCGNEKVDFGEECDPSIDNLAGGNNFKECGWNCLLYNPSSKGTLACTPANIANGGCCGNGPSVLPEAGEECDLGLLNGALGSGCTAVCLKEGTAASYDVCVNKIKKTPAECKKQKVEYQYNNISKFVDIISVCGNNAEEPGEECDNGAENGKNGKNCSASCLLQLVDAKKCGNGNVEKDNGEECDPKTSGMDGEGCSDMCKKLGASPAYGSWCGDGIVGAGESCDESPKGGAQYIDATQYATAVGLGTVKDKKQIANITATISQTSQPDKKGAAQFVLQCGFAPANSACPNAVDPANIVNGVGTDSCCYQRPTVSITQPPPEVTTNVCPNATFEVIMNGGKIDEQTIPGNIIFAEAINAADDATNCPNGSQPFAYEEKTVYPRTLWQKIIAKIKSTLGIPAHAEKFMYCGGNNKVLFKTSYDEKTNISKITITTETVLKKNTNYKLLVLNYDKNKGYGGLKDTYGLTFATENSGLDTINHVFTTANVPYCKVSKAVVNPTYHLFTKKDEIKEFSVKTMYAPAGVDEKDAQEIAPIDGQYEWKYVWNTNDASMVSLTLGKTALTANAKAEGKNGLATITGGIKVTEDTSVPSAKGQEITGEAQTQVFLCENPWPNDKIKFNTLPAPNQKTYGIGYFDASTVPGEVDLGKGWTNFKTLYCRDAGKQGFVDDLPALKPPAVLYHQDNPADPILKEFFFTFEDASNNKDSIGLRVYPNLDHKPLSAWYQSQPWIPKGNPVPAKVGAYEALQEGRTFYVAGLNIDTTTNAQNTYTNVYVWSFSDNASADTLNIFNQLLANFTLNINIDNPRVCSVAASFSCSKDLDCLNMIEDNGLCVEKQCEKNSMACNVNSDCKKIKNAGECTAPLDKATRDLKRIKDLAALANKIELYKVMNQSYPNLKNNPSLGTFIPGYTNSKWLSWQGVLGNTLNFALPSDPINQFNGCGGDGAVGAPPGTLLKDFDAQTCWNAANSTFVCPKNSYIYQYEFILNAKAEIKANFEIPELKWKNSLEDFVGNKSVLQIGGACTDQVIGLSEKCGDGVVGPGEQCEIGQTQEFSCTEPDGVTPIDWIWPTNGLHYMKHRFVQCGNDCKWGSEKVFNEKRCKISMKVCSKDSDCNPNKKDECGFYHISGPSLIIDNKSPSTPIICVPIGYCGDGVMQQDAQSGPKEVCDDGANNGKYGYCSVDCKTQGGGGYCGDGKLKLNAQNEPADPNKVCDASALFYNGLSSSKLSLWSYVKDANSFSNNNKVGWSLDDNETPCSPSSATCLSAGAKYHLQKLMSCSWDCQSFDYCGDSKVNSALKSDGTPYEECEKSEACQVGYCKDAESKFELSANGVKILCESNADCSKNTSPSCDSSNIPGVMICGNSVNDGAECKTDGDCLPKYACQNYQTGKRYCSASGEKIPEPNGDMYSDGKVAYDDNTKECHWERKMPVPNANITCLPAKSVPAPVAAGVCGDGIIQDGKKGADGKLLPGHGEVSTVSGAIPEVCDQGTQNGVIPLAAYGKTANYCAFGCGQVITVSGGFCGDKNVSGPEYCDMSAAVDDYVCEGTSTACNPKDNKCAPPSTECVPSARWSDGAKKSCDAKAQGSTIPTGSFLANCTNTCVGSCKVPVCGDKVLDPGETCDQGSQASGGKNGVVPSLGYSFDKQMQEYCGVSCQKQTVSNDFCGDEKLTVPQEQCDTVSNTVNFSDAATNACSNPAFPQCNAATCASSCVQPPSNDVDLKGVSGTSLIVQVLTNQNQKYSPDSLDDSKKLKVQWNDGAEYTLDQSNKFQIKFINLIAQPIGNTNGKLTLKKVDNGNSNVYVALYAVPLNPEQNSVITSSPTSWSWGGNIANSKGIMFSMNGTFEINIATVVVQ